MRTVGLWRWYINVIIIITTGTTALCEPWPSSGFLHNLIFMVRGQLHAQLSTWRTSVSLFVWLLPLDLSGLGGPTNRYATADIALRVSGALKSHHHDKGDSVGGGYINITVTLLDFVQRTAFFFKRTMDNFRTSLETYYVSAPSPTS
jgi:hypothetical protein